MVVLTEELVLAKTRADSLASVKNLNLWGSDLTDVSILQRLVNVEVLSLSVNKISSLQDFRHCPQLTELYLRKNEIGDIKEVHYLQGLKNLSILWLCDNPCVGSSAAEYRSCVSFYAKSNHGSNKAHEFKRKVISLLPNITKLDNIDVTEEERAAAEAPSSAAPNASSSSAPNAAASSARATTAPAPHQQLFPPIRPEIPRAEDAEGNSVKRAVMLLLGDLSADDLIAVRKAALLRLHALGRTD